MDRISREALALGTATADSATPAERWDDRPGHHHNQGLRSQDPAQAAEEHMRWLARTIEAEIIPRLMLAHCASRHPPEAPGTKGAPPPGASEVETLAQLSIAESATASAQFVEELRARGMSLDTIYMELLAPAARRLGELWEADLCNFSEVTLGLWRIQQVMYDLSPVFHHVQDEHMSAPRALLAPAPQSQHTFGLLMVSEFFRRAGWDVWARTSVTQAELIETASREWFDIFGLSLSTDNEVAELTSVILKVRAASRNRALVVMVGGPVIMARPDLVSQLGADGTSEDAASAVVEAQRLVTSRARLC